MHQISRPPGKAAPDWIATQDSEPWPVARLLFPDTNGSPNPDGVTTPDRAGVMTLFDRTSVERIMSSRHPVAWPAYKMLHTRNFGVYFPFMLVMVTVPLAVTWLIFGEHHPVLACSGIAVGFAAMWLLTRWCHRERLEFIYNSPLTVLAHTMYNQVSDPADSLWSRYETIAQTSLEAYHAACQAAGPAQATALCTVYDRVIDHMVFQLDQAMRQRRGERVEIPASMTIRQVLAGVPYDPQVEATANTLCARMELSWML